MNKTPQEAFDKAKINLHNFCAKAYNVWRVGRWPWLVYGVLPTYNEIENCVNTLVKEVIEYINDNPIVVDYRKRFPEAEPLGPFIEVEISDSGCPDDNWKCIIRLVAGEISS